MIKPFNNKLSFWLQFMPQHSCNITVIFRQIYNHRLLAFPVIDKTGLTHTNATSLCIPQWHFNSLGPSDTRRRWRSWSTLVQVMACCLMALSLTWTNVDLSSSQDIIIRRFEDTNQYSKIEDYIFRMALRSPRGPWVNHFDMRLWHHCNMIDNRKNTGSEDNEGNAKLLYIIFFSCYGLIWYKYAVLTVQGFTLSRWGGHESAASLYNRIPKVVILQLHTESAHRLQYFHEQILTVFMVVTKLQIV